MGLVVAKTEFNATPRPALRKSLDSATHPVLESGNSKPRQMGQEGTHFGNASDSVKVPRTEKLVEICVLIPKSLRKKLKSEAKNQGITFDELIVLRIRE